MTSPLPADHPVGAAPSGRRAPLEVVADLRAAVSRLEGRPARRELATHPALQGLLSLQAGGVYGVESASAALLLMAGPSAAGTWCGVVGVPELGVEAAVEVGVDPRRTVLVPEPGERWLEVTAALVDVLGLVVLRPPAGAALAPRDAERIAARLRKHGSVLVPWGPWPRTDAQLGLRTVRWEGIGHGHGRLRAREGELAVHRGAAPARRRTVRLPLGPTTTATTTATATAGDLLLATDPGAIRSAG